jgi:hypothetical protein
VTVSSFAANDGAVAAVTSSNPIAKIVLVFISATSGADYTVPLANPASAEPERPAWLASRQGSCTTSLLGTVGSSSENLGRGDFMRAATDWFIT